MPLMSGIEDVKKTSACNLDINDMKIRPLGTDYSVPSPIAEGVEYSPELSIFAVVGIFLQPR